MKSRKAPRKVGVKSPAGTSGNQDARRTGPSLEEIRLRAFEIYVERGGAHGRDLDDWLQAEAELARKTLKRHSE